MPLASCEKIGNALANKLEQNIPETTVEQDNTARELYQALLEEDEPSILLIVDPKIRKEVTANIQPIFRSLSSVRTLKPVDPLIIGIKKSMGTQYGKVLEVSYSYKYDEGDVNMTVTFKGHEGGNNIIGFLIGNNVLPINVDQMDEASVVIPEV